MLEKRRVFRRMESRRLHNMKRNIVWGILNKFIALGLPFIVRTVLIYTIGMNYVGLGSLFSSLLQVLNFAELGIGGALIFSMYKPIAEGDDKKVCALLAFYRKAYRAIGIVVLAIGLVMLPMLKYLIKGNAPQDINIYYIFIIYLINNMIGYFLYAYKQSIFIANQRMDLVSKIGMGVQTLSGILQIIILLTTRNYYLYIGVIPVITFINNMTIGICTDKFYPQYKCEGNIDRNELREIKEKVGGMIFQKIGSIVLTSVDSIVISAFLGLIPLALYQNYYYIITAVFGVLSIIMQSIIASVGNSIITESVEKNYNDFKIFNMLYIELVIFCTTCLLCLFQPFMEVWVGKENLFGNEMVFLFVVYFFVHKWCDMLYVYQEACGIWWETRFIPLIAAMTNLIMNIILVNIIGLAGILISTIIAVVFIYDIGYAKVLFGTYFKNLNELKRYWCRQGLYFISMILVAVITWYICQIVNVSTLWGEIIVNCFICITIPNIILLIIWWRLPEFKIVYQKFKIVIKEFNLKR